MQGADSQIERPLWRRVARVLVPRNVRHRLGMWVGERGVRRLPDRIYLERELLPAVARRGGRVLLVGCRPYTKHYPRLVEAHGAECWTIDIDPTVVRWGAPQRHVTGAIQGAQDHWPPSSFDTIVLNGLFGFGLDSVQDQEAALQVCWWLSKNDGWFILGWNSDRCVDPSEFAVLRHHFRPASLPPLARRQTFAGSTHVFDPFMPVKIE